MKDEGAGSLCTDEQERRGVAGRGLVPRVEPRLWDASEDDSNFARISTCDFARSQAGVAGSLALAFSAESEQYATEQGECSEGMHALRQGDTGSGE